VDSLQVGFRWTLGSPRPILLDDRAKPSLRLLRRTWLGGPIDLNAGSPAGIAERTSSERTLREVDQERERFERCGFPRGKDSGISKPLKHPLQETRKSPRG
jgi:hypothetical protein